MDELSRLNLAGGFANYINVDNARDIGFIANVPSDRVTQVGNAALDDQTNPVQVLEHGDIGGRVTVDDDQVGVLAWFQRADHQINIFERRSLEDLSKFRSNVIGTTVAVQFRPQPMRVRIRVTEGGVDVPARLSFLGIEGTRAPNLASPVWSPFSSSCGSACGFSAVESVTLDVGASSNGTPTRGA